MPLAWGLAVSPAFRTRVYEVCEALGWTEAHASWLMAAMAFETGRTFSAKTRNPRSSATGLIQFMAATARALGTTTQRLAAMSDEDQLRYVQRYFEPYAARVRSLEDLYMAILWPAAIGKPNDSRLWDAGSQAYLANRGLDSNRDGRITKGEAAAKVRDQLAEGLRHAWIPPLSPAVSRATRSGGFDGA